MNRIHALFATFLIVAAAIALGGCDRDKPANPKVADGGSAQPAAGPAEPLPAGLVLTAAPADARSVIDVKKDAAKDKDVVVTGVVAGSKEPIAANRAVFTLADVSLETCDKMPGDTCKTPWDACCGAPADIAAKSLTVQVVGAEGKPLRAGLTGVGGLAPLKPVTVKGKVRSVEGEAGNRVVVIDAAGIFVKG